MVTYSDSGEVVYEYNRQSDQIKMADQNDTVHVYEYDRVGNRISLDVKNSPVIKHTTGTVE